MFIYFQLFYKNLLDLLQNKLYKITIVTIVTKTKF